MKTRLLKRLRKEAKRKYVIKHDYYGYHVCDLIDLYLFLKPYITCVSYKDIESAKNVCNAERRKYILDEVRSMRNKHYEILDF